MSEGKLDKTKAEIKTCKFKDIRHIFEEFHYKKVLWVVVLAYVLQCFMKAF